MQDLFSNLISAALQGKLSTRLGRQLGVAALIAFASGAAVSMMWGNVVAARWASLGACLAYLASASLYAATRKRAVSTASDLGHNNPSWGMGMVLGSALGIFICLLALRLTQDCLVLLGLTDEISLGLSCAAYLAAFLTLMFVVQTRIKRVRRRARD